MVHHRMSDFWTVVFLLALLAITLAHAGTIAKEAFISTGPVVPDECKQGLYGCVYRQIPLGF